MNFLIFIALCVIAMTLVSYIDCMLYKKYIETIKIEREKRKEKLSELREINEFINKIKMNNGQRPIPTPNDPASFIR